MKVENKKLNSIIKITKNDYKEQLQIDAENCMMGKKKKRKESTKKIDVTVCLKKTIKN